MALVVASTVFLVSLREAEGTVEPRAAWVVRAAYVVLLAAIYLGTIVTGSGPHAGDADASEMIRRITHADPSERMPKEGEPLSEEEIRTLRRCADTQDGTRTIA